MKYRCRCHQHSAFHWRDPSYPGQIDWGDVKKMSVASDRSSEVVNAKRATGVDVAHLYGLSNRQQVTKLDPKRFHVFSRVGQK
jgi:hypothetical protein